MSDREDRLPDKTVDPVTSADLLKNFESRMLIGDGRSLLVRPIHPTDEDHLREAFQQLSRDTIRSRFFYLRKSLSKKSARTAASPDIETEFAFVVVDDNQSDEQLVAGGRYVLDPTSKVAELAIMVRDDWQSQGVGGFLFQRLLAIGRDRGVSDFVAFVQHDNQPMIKLIRRHAPEPVESRLVEGMFELRFSTRPAKAVGESDQVEQD